MVHTFYEHTVSYSHYIDINFLYYIDSFQMLQNVTNVTKDYYFLSSKKLSLEISSERGNRNAFNCPSLSQRIKVSANREFPNSWPDDHINNTRRDECIVADLKTDPASKSYGLWQSC